MSNPLTFSVVDGCQNILATKTNHAYLIRTAWDDWYKYATECNLWYVTSTGAVLNVGCVKIGEVGLKPQEAGPLVPEGFRSPSLPSEFSALGEAFFSVGQSEDYYKMLTDLGPDIREAILKGLRDVAYDANIWSRVSDEPVMIQSLLRFVTSTTVERQFRRMSRGGARVTPYAFSFALPKQGDEEAPHVTLQFRVAPETKPPTNVHVLIGRNGVGKTRLLNLMTKALLATKTPSPDVGEFTWEQGSDGCQRFANLVNVSFSAFDSKDIPPIQSALSGELKHSYIGLRLSPDGQTSSSAPKCAAALADEFVASLRVCQVEPLRKRWLTAMATLESDPVFQQATLTELCSLDLTTDDGKDNAVGTFDRLSSGHKIVLLTVTRLVEAVEEQTLVLVDEIEAHLHPPLLSSFVRALSSLLLDRNGVAIVATHSPVVLQEVPKLCAWVLSRSGSVTKAERPSIETFGENVGILTREVFQLELSQSGFHQLLADVAKEHGSYEAALSFGLKEQLGAEGRAVLRAIFLSKTQGGQ